MLTTSKEASPNYLAKVVKLSGLRKHDNADRLQCIDIDFQTVITGLDAKDGDVYVYFPVECKINKDFLSYTNSFRKKELNQDSEKTGFFEENCRVRAMKLRGEKSCGYIVPVEQIEEFANFNENINDYINKEFDTINGIKLLEKYVVKTKQSRTHKEGKKPKVSRLVEGQFKYHENTSNFRKVIGDFREEDEVSISYKLHGTSLILSNILVKRKLSLLDKISEFFGVNIQTEEYDVVYSSRRVIKNEYLKDEKRNSHFYSEDVWGMAAKKYGHLIPKGFTLYAELVGQLPNGQWIQKSYDYGTSPGEFEMYVYRVTYTNTEGESFELSTQQMLEFCDSLNLNTPPVFFIGTLSELMREMRVKSEEELVLKLEEKYNNKKCYMCKNSVEEEGIVIKKENLFSFEAAKLKSFAFLEQETKQLDKGESDIESEN